LNPLAGMHPEHSDLPIMCTLQGIEYIDLMRSIMHSAEQRLPAGKRSRVGADAKAPALRPTHPAGRVPVRA
jgi:D-alanine-D-alanine ligase